MSALHKQTDLPLPWRINGINYLGRVISAMLLKRLELSTKIKKTEQLTVTS